MAVPIAAACVVVSEGLIGWVRLISFGLVGRELFEKKFSPMPSLKNLINLILIYGVLTL